MGRNMAACALSLRRNHEGYLKQRITSRNDTLLIGYILFILFLYLEMLPMI